MAATPSPWINRAKAIAIVIASLGTVITAVAAHFQPEKRAADTAAAAAKSIRGLQAAVEAQGRELEDAQERCERLSAAAATSSKAEADAVRQLVLGYMLASQGRGSGGAGMRRTLGAVVEQLGKAKVKALRPMIQRARDEPSPRPAKRKMKLLPPRRLEALAEGAD
jgi:hypothetical protein